MTFKKAPRTFLGAFLNEMSREKSHLGDDTSFGVIQESDHMLYF